MHRVTMAGLGLVLSLAVATSGYALEKRIDRMPDLQSPSGEWQAATTATISYWNGCVGWTWIWNGWAAQDQFGVFFDLGLFGGGGGTLVASTVFVWSESPPGYGFTGTVDVHAADANRCPSGAPLASQSFLPGPTATWVTHSWGGLSVPQAFTVTTTTGNATFANPGEFTSDYDGIGPTGPDACGTCYPTTRTPHSYDYGTNGAFCPSPSVLTSGSTVCNSEWRWECRVGLTAVEATSWSAIKAMYE